MPTKQKLEKENSDLRQRTALLEGLLESNKREFWRSLLVPIIDKSHYFLIAYGLSQVPESLKAVAGTTTFFNTSFGVNASVNLALCIVPSVAVILVLKMLRKERKLRKDQVRVLSERNQRLEATIWSSRTSTELTPDGETNPSHE